MENKSITIITSKNKIPSVKRLLSELQAKNKELKVGAPKFGTVKENTLMNFSVTSEHYDLVVSSLAAVGINVVGIGSKVKTAAQEGSGDGPKKNVKIKTREKKKELTIEQIIKIASVGRYNDLLDIMEDNLTYSEEIRKRTKELVHDSVLKSIDNKLNKSIASKHDKGQYIEQIMEVATDQRLKTHNFQDLKIKAGEAAIKACALNSEEIHYLVKIANDKRYHETICYKAFIKFAAITLAEMGTYKDDLDIAARDINLRWMRIVSDTVGDKFDKDEQQFFERLVSYLSKRRS